MSLSEFIIRETDIEVKDGTTSYPEVRFEPGIHPTKSQEFKGVNDKFASGDLLAHYWNRSVAERMASYQPDLVSIDSLFPVTSQELSVFDKAEIWLGIPSRPLRLNRTGAIHVLSGDFSFYDALHSFSTSEQARDLSFDLENKMFSYYFGRELQKDAFSEYAGVFAAGAIFDVGMHRMTRTPKKESSEQVTESDTHSLTRRDLLRASSSAVYWGSMAYALAGIFSTDILAKSDNEMTRDVFQKVNTLTRPRIMHPKYVHGRTALLIEKTIDTFEEFDRPSSMPASILMGSFHSKEAEILMENPKKRAELIYEFARDTLSLLKHTMTSSYPELSYDDAHQAVLNHLAKADITKVIDPGTLDTDPHLPSKLDDIVQMVGSFQSNGVDKAIEPLR